MGRSHAWLPRGTELIEPRPRNWGDNLVAHKARLAIDPKRGYHLGA